MRYFILTLTVLGFLSAPALANHEAGHIAPHNVTVEVNGLVCDFCARALEKIFYKQDGVEGVNVNLDTHMVTLGLAEEHSLTDEQITNLVTEAGYNVVKITHEN